jgi:anti-anti-sigma factor
MRMRVGQANSPYARYGSVLFTDSSSLSVVGLPPDIKYASPVVRRGLVPQGEWGSAMTLPVSFSIDVVDGRTTVSFHGELDMSCQQDVEALAEAISADGSDVVFDLHDLSYMDSSGLLAILDARRLLNEREKPVQVIGAHGTVLKVIELTGMAQELNLRPDPSGLSA